MPRPLRVFLCHASQDKPAVRELYNALKSEGWIDPWLDKTKILPGQDWEMVIEKAVDASDVVVICLSNQSVTKEGFVQREIRYAYDLALEKPEDTIFLIPLRLDDCTVPRKLKTFHWVDYFGAQKQEAYADLLEALQLRYDQKMKLEAEKLARKPAVEKTPREKVKRVLAPQRVKQERIPFNEPKTVPRKEMKKEKPVAGAERKKNAGKSSPIMIGGGLWLFLVVGLFIAGIFVVGNWLSDLFVPTQEPSITKPPAEAYSIGAIMTSDGVTMMYVPAGTFLMGSEKYNEEKPLHSVDLDAFSIDKYEVTNAAYKRCVDVNKCIPPKQNSSSTRHTYYDNSEFDDYPVIYVDWNMAKTYCEWRGDRLPTEAEWEKAARSTDGRTYPWGEYIDCDKANYKSSCVGDTTKVGSYESGKSPYGVYDMAGNVWEWVNDWYDVYPGGDVSESNEFGQKYRVLRGGSWHAYDDFARSAERFRYYPSYTYYSIGFRCVRSE